MPIDSMFQLMRQDLERYFNFNLHVESKVVDCLVLRLNGSPQKVNPNTPRESNLSEQLKLPKYLRNKRLALLTRYLNNVLMTPVIDSTEYSDNVYLDLPYDLTDEVALQRYLSRQGFQLTREKRLMDMLIVSKTN